MNIKYIEKLEFNKILAILSSNCITNAGKKVAKNLHPQNDKDIVLSLLKETTEAVSLVYKKHTPSFFDIADITYISKILESNGVLNAKNLLEVARNFKASK